MKSPMGGTSGTGISMRTTPAATSKYRALVWQAYRDDAGQLKFKRLKEKKVEVSKSGPVDIEATIPLRVMGNEAKLRGLAHAIAGAGGSIVESRGRMMSVSSGYGSEGEIGDVLDSFGCQWDVQ